ncbi:unnamed protein product [Pleuronectes platessa]|uniref:Uncharacterized protein n=1 Tax=Pleuronectes platessa TaxID=8262 RepID=A0A9N7ZBB0_PLEPL|nr:unnamed protein product [Pleuronectes platessa]
MRLLGEWRARGGREREMGTERREDGKEGIARENERNSNSKKKTKARREQESKLSKFWDWKKGRKPEGERDGWMTWIAAKKAKGVRSGCPEHMCFGLPRVELYLSPG